MKVFRFFEYAYLAIMCFFAYEAYNDWGEENSRSMLYLFFAIMAAFMFFFKRNFRKRFDANDKN
ncbi:hypothetical protein M0D21_06445 [Aquimarina sp. D1M17]|uniref:hypothetical protein n=1 Tax=Aquimarina acroporae TaxID=2937283 RepID=UPI0020BF89E4|nr:hypothetical protein [Aquimarina acroporae]MCK8521196.1 hypothetical protein [Aquimarina acroporae]